MAHCLDSQTGPSPTGAESQVESSEKAAGEALTEPKKRKKRNSAEAEPVRATEENTQKPDTVATETEKKQKKKDKKKRQQADSGNEPSEAALDQPAEGALLTEEQQPGKKAKKGKAAKRKKVADAKKPSGPGNASEAAQIRTVMGAKSSFYLQLALALSDVHSIAHIEPDCLLLSLLTGEGYPGRGQAASIISIWTGEQINT